MSAAELVLSHYTEQPFTLDLSRTYSQDNVRGFKPKGLWLSVDDEDNGWKDWCEREGYFLESLTHRTDYALADTANIVTIASLTDLEAFTLEYGTLDVTWTADRKMIDWQRVAREHDGILLNPYHRAHAWEIEDRRAIDLMWHYGWDCSSGCFWNLQALQPISNPALAETNA